MFISFVNVEDASTEAGSSRVYQTTQTECSQGWTVNKVTKRSSKMLRDVSKTISKLSSDQFDIHVMLELKVRMHFSSP